MTVQVYLDTSTLVKRYVAEAGSDDVAALLKEAQYQAASIVTEAELPAALGRATRMGLITERDGQAALKAWEQDREELLWIQLPQITAQQAGQLAVQDGLRGYDAIHLATALWWQTNLGQELIVATYDRELWRAAKVHGLSVFPEQEP
jgi:predicted nucleic acid-binding protein